MDTELVVTISVVGVALIALGVLLFTGALRERALSLGPERDLGLPHSVHLAGVVAVCVYVLAMIVLGGLKDPADGLVLQIAPFALIGLLIGRAMNTEGGARKIGLVPRRPGRDVCWAGVALIVGYALAGAASLLTGYLAGLFGDAPDPVGHETLRRLQEDPNAGLIVAVVIGAVVMAPLLEEPVFRGVMQTGLMRLMSGRRWPALVITAAVFSVVHWWAVTSWHGLVPLFVLGLVFGYVYERTGSLLTPALTHAGFNVVNILIALTVPAG